MNWMKEGDKMIFPLLTKCSVCDKTYEAIIEKDLCACSNCRKKAEVMKNDCSSL